MLNKKQSAIVLISAFTATGDLQQLKLEINHGLEAGLTVNEIKEIMVQLYAYAGFPRSLNALYTFMEVLKERKINGLEDVMGKTARPYPNNKSKLEFGTENQTLLIGSPVQGEVYQFAPVIDQFLKEHLFGDIFGRDVLDFQTREIATIAALASMHGTANQLRSHLRVGMHNGLEKDQIDHLIAIIFEKIGPKEGFTAATVFGDLTNRTSQMQNKSNQNSNFTGTVSVNIMVSPDSIFNTQMGSVTFEAGARTNWHYHPSGQILLITEGVAHYQEKGKSLQTFNKGQVIKCPPNVSHWHGAHPKTTMTHLALTPDLQNGGVVWQGAVSDEEYSGNAE